MSTFKDDKIMVMVRSLPEGVPVELPGGEWITTNRGRFRCTEAWIEKDGYKEFKVFAPDAMIEILD